MKTARKSTAASVVSRRPPLLGGAGAALAFAAAMAALAAVLVIAAPADQQGAIAGEVRTAPEFQGIDAWLNSEPLAIDQLRGRVVLVDFWAYGCSNCLNHLPYVKDWHEKYKDQGLVVVSVHTPEFAFEKPIENLRRAVEQLQISHAVAQDNNYATWRAFRNQYWPAVYLIDKQGRIVYSHYGEGSYGETEKKIRALLAQSFPEEP